MKKLGVLLIALLGAPVGVGADVQTGEAPVGLPSYQPDSRTIYYAGDKVAHDGGTIYTKESSLSLQYIERGEMPVTELEYSFNEDFSDSVSIPLTGIGGNEYLGTLTVTTTNLSEGPHTLYTRGTYGFGDGGTYPWTIFIDTKAPVAAPAMVTLFRHPAEPNATRVTATFGNAQDPAPSSGVDNIVMEVFKEFEGTQRVILSPSQNYFEIYEPANSTTPLAIRVAYIDQTGNRGPWSPLFERGDVSRLVEGNNQLNPYLSRRVMPDGQLAFAGAEAQLTPSSMYGWTSLEWATTETFEDAKEYGLMDVDQSSFPISIGLTVPPGPDGPLVMWARFSNGPYAGPIREVRLFRDNLAPLPGAFPSRIVPFHIPLYGNRAMVFDVMPEDPEPGSGIGSFIVEMGSSEGGSDRRVDEWVPQGIDGNEVPFFTGSSGSPIYVSYTPVDRAGNVGVRVSLPDPMEYNEGPVVTMHGIYPPNPRTLDNLIADFEVTHPTNAPIIEYESYWVRDNIEYLPNTDTLPASYTSRDQVWRFRLRARDAIQWGLWRTVSVVIQNTPPTQPVVEIRPRVPSPDEDLIVNVLEYSTDVDGDQVGYDFAWFQSKDNGVTWIQKAELNGSPQVSNLFIDEGDVWRVEYTPFDVPVSTKGVDRGDAGYAASDQIFVGVNELPVVSIETPIQRGTGPEARLTFDFEATDPDGDLARIVLSWTDRANSGLVPIATVEPGVTTFDGVVALPAEGDIYIHIAAYDANGALTQVLSEPAAKEWPLLSEWVLY